MVGEQGGRRRHTRWIPALEKLERPRRKRTQIIEIIAPERGGGLHPREDPFALTNPELIPKVVHRPQMVLSSQTRVSTSGMNGEVNPGIAIVITSASTP